MFYALYVFADVLNVATCKIEQKTLAKRFSNVART